MPFFIWYTFEQQNSRTHMVKESKPNKPGFEKISLGTFIPGKSYWKKTCYFEQS